MMRIMLPTLAALALAGCASAPIQIDTKPIENNIVQPADPRPPQLKDVNWQVVTKDNLDQFIQAQSKKQNSGNPVFVALTMQDYQTLSMDLAELKRYIDQQKNIIVYYKNATAPAAKPK